MDNIIGITEQRLAEIVETAARRGYETARREMEQSDWLLSRTEICRFLNPSRPLSVTTFNRNRQRGVYGSAVYGVGASCKARKSELLDAVRRYQTINN